MVWSEDNLTTVGSRKPTVRNLRNRKVNRYRPGLDSVSSDNFIKGLAKVGIKLFTKDPAKEAEKLAKLENDKYLNGLDKAIKGAVGIGASIVGAKGIADKLKKESTPASVSLPSMTVDTSGFKPTLVKPAINLPGTSNAPASSANPSPFTSVFSAANDTSRPVGEAPVANGLVNSILRAADKLPDSVKNAAKQYAENSGILSKAQEALRNASASAGLLPKTQKLKDAERLLTTPQNAGMFPTEIGGINSGIVWAVVAVAVVGALVYFGNK